MSKVVTIEADSAGFTSSPYLPAGLRNLGKYKLIYRFASGGMANLYLGRFAGPDGFEKLVAIKVIHDHLTQNPEFVKMFVDEARLVSRIYHPNVAQIIELGRVGRSYFIAMEYVEGESVGAILRRTKPSLPVACRIIADAAAGLHAAHELRNNDGELFHVVHRDVSPQNILVSYSGTTKVVDFGVAHARGMLHTTKDGSLKGKFGYMAPEQASSQPMDRRADVFVLGVVLYELTTRTKLFKAQTDSETMQKVLKGEITPPSQVDPGYPKELEQVVLRALRRDPAERFQTAEEMQAAIEKFIVTHGDPVLTSQVGKMMRDIFVDRIKKKKRVLSAVKDDSLQALPNVDFGDVPDVDMERSSQSTWFTRFTGTLARRRTAVIVGGVAVLCGLGIFFGYPLLTGNGSTASHHPGSSTRASTRAHPDAGPPAPRTVSIGVQVTPRTARLRFAGKRVSNPYTFKGAAAERRVEVVAAAPGYKTKRVKVSLGRDTQLMLELSKLEPAPQPEPEPAAKQGEPGEPPRSVRARNQKKRRKKGKKKLADDDVLVNPYH